jgi:hypothetical protein
MKLIIYRRVLAAGAVASTTRAIIETPLEFAKVSKYYSYSLCSI